MNIRDQIRQADDIETRLVEVPEWGVTIELRTPTVAARGAALADYIDENGLVDRARAYPSLVISCAYDPEDGSLLFTPADIGWLGEKSSAALERLGAVAVELSGLKNVEERIKAGKADSKPTSNGATSTGSRNVSVRPVRSSSKR